MSLLKRVMTYSTALRRRYVPSAWRFSDVRRYTSAVANHFVPGSAFLRLFWSLNAQVGLNVLGVSCPAGVTINQALADNIAAALKTNWASQAISSKLATSTQLTAIGIRDYRTANQAEFLGAPAGGIGTGTATGDALPRHIALVATLRTDKAGKSFRGRFYMPGWAESENSATGSASQTDADALVTWLLLINSTLTSNGMATAVVSRPSDAITRTRTVTHSDGTVSTETRNYPARAGAVTPVTKTQVRNLVWDTQRRRNNGRGELASFLVSNAAATMNFPQVVG